MSHWVHNPCLMSHIIITPIFKSTSIIISIYPLLPFHSSVNPSPRERAVPCIPCLPCTAALPHLWSFLSPSPGPHLCETQGNQNSCAGARVKPIPTAAETGLCLLCWMPSLKVAKYSICFFWQLSGIELMLLRTPSDVSKKTLLSNNSHARPHQGKVSIYYEILKVNFILALNPSAFCTFPVSFSSACLEQSCLNRNTCHYFVPFTNWTL